MKVVHMAMGTLVRRHELRHLLDGVLAINVVAHARQDVAVDVIRVVLWAIPQEDLEEGAWRGDVGPHHAG